MRSRDSGSPVDHSALKTRRACRSLMTWPTRQSERVHDLPECLALTREDDSQPLRVTGRVRVVRPLDGLLSVATLVRAACNLWTWNRTGSITERGSTQQPKSGASQE